jgi:hypothetical protein
MTPWTSLWDPTLALWVLLVLVVVGAVWFARRR